MSIGVFLPSEPDGDEHIGWYWRVKEACMPEKILYDKEVLMNPEDVKKFIELIQMNVTDAEIGYDRSNRKYSVVIKEL